MMKWWGWGDPKIDFEIDDKPFLWPYVVKSLDIPKKFSDHPEKPIDRNKISLPEPKINHDFVEALSPHLRNDQILTDEDERILHTYGKSYPDIFKARKGIFRPPPDMVILPENHQQVVAIIRSANQFDVGVIPFGGGSNIIGCVEPADSQNRMMVSLNLRKMNRLLSLNKESLTATIEAGALGPKLEEDLEAQGFCLGHHPDSFLHSTLGGWIATRSAGMQSDEYGRIEDMVVSLRVVTPSGEIATRTVPASSAGIDVNRLIIGSEGILGVITEATMKIHPNPPIKDYYGFLFKTFDDGTHAIHQCYQKGFTPSMFRLQDLKESELAMSMKPVKKGLQVYVEKLIKPYLKRKGFTSPCIMVVGFEGDKEKVGFTKKHVFPILKQWGAFPLGKSIGKTWSKHKYNIPYFRDFLMNYHCYADVAETSATWSNLLPLYHKTMKAVQEKFREQNHYKGWIGCHISHSYNAGACLYFTFAGVQKPGRELEQFYEIKECFTETFMKNGGALSHHHAVGLDHLPWLEEEVSPTGIKAYKGLKQALDPKKIMNPGKLIPERAHEYMRAKKAIQKKRDKPKKEKQSPPPPPPA